MSHPAPFSKAIVCVLAAQLTAAFTSQQAPLRVLDPFAGTGRIHSLKGQKCATLAIEIEPEWAEESALSGETICADSIAWALGTTEMFDAIITSPVYPNGVADNYVGAGKTRRNTYASHLGRKVTDGSNAGLGRWSSPKQRDAHIAWQVTAWKALIPRIVPGGVLILNTKDPMWSQNNSHSVGPFTSTLWTLLAEQHALVLEHLETIATRGLPDGLHSEQRTGFEYVLRFRKPTR